MRRESVNQEPTLSTTELKARQGAVNLTEPPVLNPIYLPGLPPSLQTV